MFGLGKTKKRLAELEEKAQKLEEIEKQKAEEEANHPRNRKEPWVEIIGESIDPEKGIKIELDWNESFIKYLKSSGFSGPSDEVIVQQWIAYLYRDMTDRMMDETVEAYGKRGDYE